MVLRDLPLAEPRNDPGGVKIHLMFEMGETLRTKFIVLEDKKYFNCIKVVLLFKSLFSSITINKGDKEIS